MRLRKFNPLSKRFPLVNRNLNSTSQSPLEDPNAAQQSGKKLSFRDWMNLFDNFPKEFNALSMLMTRVSVASESHPASRVFQGFESQ